MTVVHAVFANIEYQGWMEEAPFLSPWDISEINLIGSDATHKKKLSLKAEK